MVLYISGKYHENISDGFKLQSTYDFMTERRTYGRTDRPWEKQCLPTCKGWGGAGESAEGREIMSCKYADPSTI